MSGSLASVRRNACVHRPDLGFYSHPKEFWRNGVRTHVDSKIPSTGKILLLRGSNPRRCIEQDSKPNQAETKANQQTKKILLRSISPSCCALRMSWEGVRKWGMRQKTQLGPASVGKRPRPCRRAVKYRSRTTRSSSSFTITSGIDLSCTVEEQHRT